MPKTEKKLKDDVTALQQKVKRKTQSPGNPTDVGEWEGATYSRYRNGSFGGIGGYALEFVSSPSFSVLHNWINIFLFSFIMAPLCTLKLKKPVEEALRIGDSIITVWIEG